MLFQMGPDAAAIRARAAEGGLAPECRAATGFATNEAFVRASGRVYLFSPEPWTAGLYEAAVGRISP